MRISVFLVVTAIATQPASGQTKVTWRDPSPHATQLVTVEKSVQLEVLDWGGAGIAVVFLAGSGHGVHVYDDFAPKLAAFGHTYGITRRGWGRSSQPSTGYDNQRLTDDLVAVLDRLKLSTVVLVGHSAAGHEMTTLARQHPGRVAGLVYLDALGDSDSDPAVEPAWLEMARTLPPPGPRPECPQDRSSFAAFRTSRQCAMGFPLPEGEWRNTCDGNTDGFRGGLQDTSGAPACDGSRPPGAPQLRRHSRAGAGTVRVSPDLARPAPARGSPATD
jgi:non-heme chloroperoxidase